MTGVDQFKDPQGRLWMVLPAPPYIDGNGGQKLLDLAVHLIPKNVRHLILNMEGTRAANSIGISRMILMLETLDESGGRIAFCAIHPTIRRTLQVMGLMQKALVFDTLEEATAACVGGAG